jgi:hypothetical protein
MISKKLIQFVEQSFKLRYGEWHQGKCDIIEVLKCVQTPMSLIKCQLTRDLMRDAINSATTDDIDRMLECTDFTDRKCVLSVMCVIGNICQSKKFYSYKPNIPLWLEQLHEKDGYFDVLELIVGLGWTYHSIPFKLGYIVSVPGGANVQAID